MKFDHDLVCNMINNAKEEDILKSCFHCHAKYVHSIVLKTDTRDGIEYLTRLYLTFPGHRLLYGTAVVGAHNHRYNIEISGIYNPSYIYNHLYKESEYSHAYSYKKYQVQTNFCKSAPTIKEIGKAGLVKTSYNHLSQNHNIILSANTIHSMTVHTNYTGWIVRELKHINNTTYLYQNNPIDTTDLYQKPTSKQEVIDLYNNFLSNYSVLTLDRDPKTDYLSTGSDFIKSPSKV